MVLDGAERRAKRLEDILQKIRVGNGINTKSLMGYICINMGLTEKTAMAYINELWKYGLIYKKGEKFYARR